jgi:LEA14-like dessication related protein
MKTRSARLYIPAPLAPGIESGDVCSVCLGKMKIPLTVEVTEKNSKKDENTVLISPELARYLGLPGSMRFNVRTSGKTVRLGPVVGILSRPFNKQRRSFGSQDRFLRSLLMRMKELDGLAFVFSQQNIDLERKRIHGYYLSRDAESAWIRHWFPLPDVYYNRYFPGTNVLRSRDLAIMLSRYGVKSFNSPVGNKWVVFRQLNKEKDIAGHLPETRLLVSPASLASLLNKYSGVYVKPVNGCKGRAISRVTRKQGRYLVKNNQDRLGKILNSVQEVYNRLRSANPNEILLAQQAIKAPSGKNHFDVRVMLQKDRHNRWAVTGIAAREGVYGHVTTNLHTGGKAASLDKVLQARNMGNDQIEGIVGEIVRLGLRIGQTLEKRSSSLGDLGLDFMIDEKGKVWFLEVNPKPGRRSFSYISKETRKVVVSRPMDYACYLAGF